MVKRLEKTRQGILPFAKHKFFAKNLNAQIRFNVNDQGKVVGLTNIQVGKKTAPRVDRYSRAESYIKVTPLIGASKHPIFINLFQ